MQAIGTSDDRDAEQRFDVDVMGLGLELVPEEDDEVDAPFGDTRADLLVAAERSAQEPDGQIELGGDEVQVVPVA